MSESNEPTQKSENQRQIIYNRERFYMEGSFIFIGFYLFIFNFVFTCIHSVGENSMYGKANLVSK